MKAVVQKVGVWIRRAVQKGRYMLSHNRVVRLLVRIGRRFWRHSRLMHWLRGLPFFVRLSAGIVLVLVIGVLGILFYRSSVYQLSPAETKLLTRPSVSTKLIKEDKKAVTYNREEEAKKELNSVVLANEPTDSTNKATYQATLNKDPAAGVSISDNKGDVTVKLTPKFSLSGGKYNDGRMVYPQGLNTTHIYTFKRNGIKEDIVMARAGSDRVQYEWELNTGDLDAKLLPNGSIGFYAASPYLYGDLQVSDQKSQQLVDNAKKNGKKDYLAFVIPAPYMVDGRGKKDYQNVSFKLEGNRLRLTAKNLKKQHYPLSIDPTVVVTTTSDFLQGNDNGNIDYSTSGQIQDRAVADGTFGTFGSPSYFSTPREGHAAVAYNGYLYISGGDVATSTSACKNSALGRSNNYCSDVQYAAISSNGSLGSFSNAGYFSNERSNHTSVVYNGNLYIIGGFKYTSDQGGAGLCKPLVFGVSSNACSDVQYAAISSNGSLGSFSTSSNTFAYPRGAHSSVAYNGYLYVIGGDHGLSDANCKNSGTNTYCNDIQYATINADGSIGAFGSPNYFSTARNAHSSVAYNGYLYIIGGVQSSSSTACKNTGISSTYCNDIQYAAINTDGSVAAFTTTNTTYFTTPRGYHRSVVYNGYLYIAGGLTDSTSACKNDGNTNTDCNDIQIGLLKGDGSIGPFSTSTNYFSYPRDSSAIVMYNGFLYSIGGFLASNSTNCKDPATSPPSNKWCSDIQYASFNNTTTNATPNTYGVATSMSYFTTARYGHASVVYNSYLYIVGGYDGTNYKSDIQYAPIAADGSIGNFATNTNSFSVGRINLTAVAYNGRLYIIGGRQSLSDTNSACQNTGSNNARCNSIQYATINADGSVGTFSTNTNYFAVPRESQTSVVNNGYLYVIGGAWTGPADTTTCKGSGPSGAPPSSTNCNDVQYAAISGVDGSVGNFGANPTAYFDVPRNSHASVVSNNYLYIIGGSWAGAADTTTCKGGTPTPASSTVCNDIQYAALSGVNGSVGSFTPNTTYFKYPRSSHTVAVNNGYLYIMGGNQGVSSTNCKNTTVSSTACNDIQYAAINSGTGAIGSFTTNTNYFNYVRFGHASVANNGYLYVIGGQQAASSTNCKNSGTSLYCNDIQYMAINFSVPDAKPAAFANATYLPNARYRTGVVAYNGYLYVSGGLLSASSTACKSPAVSSQLCNDVQYAAINADGSLGSFNLAGYFSTPRYSHAALAYNGYFYILGGVWAGPADTTTCKDVTVTGGTPASSVVCNDVQYALIKSDGSFEAFNTISHFDFPRGDFGAVTSSGYMYIIGGSQSVSSSNCKDSGTSTVCNDVQAATIDSTGAVGTFNTVSHFSVPRAYPGTVVNNGYLYIAGGILSAASTSCKNTGSSNTYCNDVQYATIGAGSVGAFNPTSYINSERGSTRAAVYNNYLYLTGGEISASSTACKSSGSSSSQMCNDVQYASINGDGTLGGFSSDVNYFNYPRELQGTLIYNGYLYVIGGAKPASDATCLSSGSGQICNDVQYAQLRSASRRIEYQKVIDFGSSTTWQALVVNYTSPCGTPLTGSYRKAGTDYIFGASTSLGAITSGAAITVNAASTRYVLLTLKSDDTICNSGRVSIQDVTVTDNHPPDAPTLSTPSDGASGVSITPQFQFRTTDADGDYLRYKIEICSTSTCSAVVRTVNQVSSQTGWSGQDQQVSTAYTGNSVITSSTMAVYDYQLPGLSLGTQYWWRAYAIDPGGTNGFGSASAIRSFTTISGDIQFKGGTEIRGGTRVGN